MLVLTNFYSVKTRLYSCCEKPFRISGRTKNRIICLNTEESLLMDYELILSKDDTGVVFELVYSIQTEF